MPHPSDQSSYETGSRGEGVEKCDIRQRVAPLAERLAALGVEVEVDDTPWSARTRAALRELAPGQILVDELCADEHWWRCVELVREDAGVTDELVTPYVRNHVLGRALVQRLLEVAANEETRRRARSYMVMAAGTSQAFTDLAELKPGDAYRLRAEDTLYRGARLVVRRGAGVCGSCRNPLVPARPRNLDTGRPYWRDYCHACAPADAHRDRPAIKALLDGAAASVLKDRPSRPRARRARRTSPATAGH